MVCELVAQFEVRTEGFKDEAEALVSAFRNRELYIAILIYIYPTEYTHLREIKSAGDRKWSNCLMPI